MSTHATAGKVWTEKELEGLTVEDQFRLRGLEVTRLDTFVDAAFAFVLTLLVISFDAIPSNYPEMLAAVRRIPGFAASFAILMMFWLQHRLWSRRYGLENFNTILL
ncbi:MAG: TMEM175 family protein, partial [Woeseiaceae bacterium]